MAFGFPAYHVERASFAESDHALAALALSAMEALRWEVVTRAPLQVAARRKVSFWSWGEVVTCVVDGQTLTVKSRCRLITQCFDWGRNRQNVVAFFDALPATRQLSLSAVGTENGGSIAISALPESISRDGERT